MIWMKTHPHYINIMKKKKKVRKVLVDLSELKNIYCGLGQIALAYGKYFENNYKRDDSDYSLTLLMPKAMFGDFGNEVAYINSSNWLRKYCRLLFPIFDVWHSTHQLSRFKPVSPRTKFLLTIHDLNYLYETAGAKRFRKHRQLQRKVDLADKIVCISKYTKQEVEKHLVLNGKQCEVIYNGLNDVLQHEGIKPDREIKKPFFLSVGVLRRKKNFHVLLDMMKLFSDKHLYIAGDLSYPDGYALEIAQRIEEENIQNITLLGKVSQEEKNWLYANCEAFLFPSLLEGFGLPIIEAMQFGKPVFSSSETSLREIGGGFSFLWDNFNPHEMKQLIDDNLSEFNNNSTVIEEEKEYAGSFSYEKHFTAYEKLYNTI